jgi:hypothetical protein
MDLSRVYGFKLSNHIILVIMYVYTSFFSPTHELYG